MSAVKQQGGNDPSRCALRNTRGEEITYGDLSRKSDALAAYFLENIHDDKPVVVYGHKSPLMLVAFLAALKSGHAYAPVDIAYPFDRVEDILSQIGNPFVVSLADDAFEDDQHLAQCVLSKRDVEEICALPCDPIDPDTGVSGDDTFYLLFTSGSTGRPKGVQMPARGVDNFLEYFLTFMPTEGPQIYFNRVPYTFDVSLFDIIPGLASGVTLFALEQEHEQSMAQTFEAFKESAMTVWISTPSFIEMCLADKAFNAALLPKLQKIVLCGEVFRNATALQLLDRFPGVEILNTYGPTETQAVTALSVDRELAETLNPLPVGYLSPGMEAVIYDPETLQELPQNAVGEIYLVGNTVSSGYFKRPDLNEKAFSEKIMGDGSCSRCYKTGDKGYLDEQGRLFCLGRLDFQVKLNGFRVELGDVEQHISSLPYVENAVVLPAEKEGKVVHLVGHVVLSDPDLPPVFRTAQKIRNDLKKSLPEYMIPKKITFHDSFVLNTSGKVDRKALS
ncbi:MAG: D-alanine--poly(phosphoribitol) ligase subunit DltA [Raoultibacter sp.]